MFFDENKKSTTVNFEIPTETKDVEDLCLQQIQLIKDLLDSQNETQLNLVFDKENHSHIGQLRALLKVLVFPIHELVVASITNQTNLDLNLFFKNYIDFINKALDEKNSYLSSLSSETIPDAKLDLSFQKVCLNFMSQWDMQDLKKYIKSDNI